MEVVADGDDDCLDMIFPTEQVLEYYKGERSDLDTVCSSTSSSTTSIIVVVISVTVFVLVAVLGLIFIRRRRRANSSTNSTPVVAEKVGHADHSTPFQAPSAPEEDPPLVEAMAISIVQDPTVVVYPVPANGM